MCDTMVLATDQGTWFAKNSDREPDEIQKIEQYRRGTSPVEISTTYRSVQAVRNEIAATIISRPAWMWGAEMGVNEYGVAIGNEAVFTRYSAAQRRLAHPRLLGMDLLRLALAQSRNSHEAVEILTHYLKRYGQGGPAGFRNKRFVYDNAFLIADGSKAFHLETAGPHWVCRSVRTEAISNRLCINEPVSHSSSGLYEVNFARRNSAWLMPQLARAERRQTQARQGLKTIAAKSGQGLDPDKTREALQELLGSHQFSQPAGTGDLCMHARWPLCPHQTVNSMIAWLPHKGTPRIWMTGKSHPCRSPFHEIIWVASNRTSIEKAGTASLRCPGETSTPIHGENLSLNADSARRADGRP